MLPTASNQMGNHQKWHKNTLKMLRKKKKKNQNPSRTSRQTQGCGLHNTSGAWKPQSIISTCSGYCFIKGSFSLPAWPHLHPSLSLIFIHQSVFFALFGPFISYIIGACSWCACYMCYTNHFTTTSHLQEQSTNIRVALKRKKKEHGKRCEIGRLPWQQCCKFQREHPRVLWVQLTSRTTGTHPQEGVATAKRQQWHGEGRLEKGTNIKAEQEGADTPGEVSYCISLEQRMFGTQPFSNLHRSIPSLCPYICWADRERKEIHLCCCCHHVLSKIFEKMVIIIQNWWQMDEMLLHKWSQ